MLLGRGAWNVAACIRFNGTAHAWPTVAQDVILTDDALKDHDPAFAVTFVEVLILEREVWQRVRPFHEAAASTTALLT